MKCGFRAASPRCTSLHIKIDVPLQHTRNFHWQTTTCFTTQGQRVKRAQTLSFKQMRHLREAEPHLSSPRGDASTGITLSLRTEQRGMCDASPLARHPAGAVCDRIQSFNSLSFTAASGRPGWQQEKKTLHSQVKSIYVSIDSRFRFMESPRI